MDSLFKTTPKEDKQNEGENKSDTSGINTTGSLAVPTMRPRDDDTRTEFTEGHTDLPYDTTTAEISYQPKENCVVLNKTK